MKNLYYRIKNALAMFVWALKNPQTMQENNFKMLSDLFTLIMKVANENRHYMTRVAMIHPDTGKEHTIVSIWAGAGLDSDPTKRITELISENNRLKIMLEEEIFKNQNK